MPKTTAHKLGKLSLAVLENFIKSKLGDDFLHELRGDYDRAGAIAQALGTTEVRFKSEFSDKSLSKALFVDLSQKDRPLLARAVGKFYDHPSDSEFLNVLRDILLDEFKEKLSEEEIVAAVKFYADVLTEELALADEIFRENVRALIDLRGDKSQQEMVNSLHRLETFLSTKKETPKVESVLLRSLHQLPPPPVDFTGRKAITEELMKDFEADKDAKLSRLTGMGGIGKTALGLEIAHKIAENYPDAQIFLDLKGTTTPINAVDIMRHVILSFEPTADLHVLDEANISAVYQSVLHGRKVFLFLDNARSAEQIVPLLPPEACALLVTSRWNFPVAGLKSHKVGLLEENEAVNFLLELCQRINGKASDLAKACAYLPLALRIAGSFLQVNEDWSIDKYLGQLKDRKQRLVILKESRNDADLTTEPDLFVTFELSYSQLSEENQRLWRMLAVFTNSFTWSAASYIWSLVEAEPRKLLGLFSRYSLLEFNESASRYILHDLLVDFALEKLDKAEDIDTRYRYAQYYLNMLRSANVLYAQGGKNILSGLQILDREWEHINNGYDWAVNNADLNNDVLSLINKYPIAGNFVLPFRFRPSVHVQWLLRGLSAAENLDEEVDKSIHLGNLGNAYSRYGQIEEAINQYEQQLIIVRKLGYRLGESIALGNLGIAFAKLGRREDARGLFEQQLILMREVGDRRGEGKALGNLGNIYKGLGEVGKAIGYYEEDLKLTQEIGDRQGEMISLGSLGFTYAGLNKYEMAMPLFEQQLIIARELGDKHGEGMSLAFLGYAKTVLGLPDEGTRMIRQAIAILEDIESPDVQWPRDRLKDLGLKG